MQVVHLVTPGKVDKVLAFDELPGEFLKGIESCSAKDSGFPRHSWDYAKMHYYLYYTFLNDHIKAWSLISHYVRTNVDKTFRLMDKLEQMAVPVAPNANQSATVEIEQVPVIPLLKAVGQSTVVERGPELGATEPPLGNPPLVQRRRYGRRPREGALTA
jgi:hypothetical protein